MSSVELEKSSDLKNLDLTKVPALQLKRTLAFINHFVVSTVQFMNDFSRKCEYKLMELENKMQNVEASLVLLETKLLSIPEIDAVVQEKSALPTKENLEEYLDCIEKIEMKTELEVDHNPETQDPALTYPEYDRFVKMVQVGVPLPAVKLKLSLEGLDPNVLDGILRK